MNSELRVKILSAVSHSHYLFISVPLSHLHHSYALTHHRTRANHIQVYMYRDFLTSLVLVFPLLHLLIPRITGSVSRAIAVFILSPQFSSNTLTSASAVWRYSCVNFAPLLCIPLVTLYPPPGSQISCPSCVAMHSSPLHYLAFTHLTLPFSHLRVNSIILASSSFRQL